MRAGLGRQPGQGRGRRGRPGSGYRGAGKIQGVTLQIGDDLHDVRTLEFFEALERPAQRAHLDRCVGEKRRDGCVDGLRLDQRLVALDVDDGAAGQVADRLGDPIGAAHVVGARHQRGAAERSHSVRDALVIGRDDHGVHARGRGGAAIHVLDHRLAGDVGENFSGETGGVEPRRDDCEDRRFSQRKWQTLDRIGVHDESYHRGLR